MVSFMSEIIFDADMTVLDAGEDLSTYEGAVKFTLHNLPHNFYDRTQRSISLVSWFPWPGQDREIVPENEFIYYCEHQNVERIPSMTSFHGHPLIMPVVHIEYLGRSRKFLKCKVTFVRRHWDATLEKVVEESWVTVPGVQGDNNHIRLIEALPGETELDLDQSLFFTETPAEMDLDFDLRMKRAYENVLLQVG